MGNQSNWIKEESLTENLFIYTVTNPKKETILFSSDKTKPKIDNPLNQTTTLNTNCKSTECGASYISTKGKVKYKIIWEDKEKNRNKNLEVLLLGSFLDNWKKYEEMKKNRKNGNYEYEAYLTKEEHVFKFIVNGRWMCSDLYQMKPDEHGNINNYIDLTNFEEEVKEKKYEDNSFNVSKELNKINQSSQTGNNITTDIEEIDNKKYQVLEKLNKKVPELGPFYLDKFDINNLSNQAKLKKFSININNVNNDLFSNANNSYKKVFTFHHDKLGHLISEISGFNHCKNNYLRFSTTERKKHKYITIIYYKPKM